MITTRIEPREQAQRLGTMPVNLLDADHKEAPRADARFVWDLACIIGAWALVLVVSHDETFTWLYTPDSEFYASLSAFGSEITDRATEDAYYWTKLGIIAPQYFLSRVFGFVAAHEIFRAALLLLIMLSGYVVARARGSRLIAILSALLLGLNTVILGFLGDTYATGAALACLSVIFALCYIWPLADGWHRVPLSLGIGVSAGWLIMLHPNFVLVSAASAGVFMLGNVTLRRRVHILEVLGHGLALVAGFILSCLVFLLLGAQVFPGMKWVETVTSWTRRLNTAAYASKNWDWIWTEGSLLVPLICLIVCFGVWILTRKAEVGLYFAVCAAAIAALAIMAAASGGPTLEASFFNACLWPSSLMALIAAMTATPAAARSSGWLMLIPAFLTVGSWIALGHWDRPQPTLVLVAVAGTTALITLALVGTSLHLTMRNSGVAVALLVFAFAVAGGGAQLLQNGRSVTPTGPVPRQPYWNSYVQSQAEEAIRLNLGIQSWVLGNTASADRVAVWVQPESQLHGAAGMSLWGPNAVALGYAVGEGERASLRYLDPSVVVLYGNDMAAIKRMIAALGKAVPVDSTACKTFSLDGATPVSEPAGTSPAIACIARLTKNS